MWTVLLFISPTGMEVPVKAFPTYMECGQYIPTAEIDYFPEGIGDWMIVCDETLVHSSSPIPKTRGTQ